MTRILDASVALKWFVDEPGSSEARTLLAAGERLVAPELLLSEVANAAWKATRRGGMTSSQVRAAMDMLCGGMVELVPLTELARVSADLALRRDHPAYDCFYVALAQRAGAPLVTADAKLARVFAEDCDIRLLYPSASA